MNTAALIVLLSSAPALAPGGLPAGWEPLTFPKIKAHTSYEWDASSAALHARAERSASGLIVRREGSIVETPILRWRWKIDRLPAGGDEHVKKGDDYAARIYVTFLYDPSREKTAARLKYGLLKKLRRGYAPHAALIYIWANKLPQGQSTRSPYTKRVIMVAARSGDAGVGEWRSEERNVLEDYRRLFGEEPPSYSGIAIMTDADNTKDAAEAWYADISLSAQ
ncbi:MAG: DUF3047 domain-containing protein [Elusimicrobia bacterium]|nr:DUF3047 domain-containing protein [Elusimicrobiota bacterium]